MMIRARIVAEGDVQKAGYRDEVQKIARELGVKGFVENLRDGNVGIVCEARKEVIDKFVKKIKIKKDFIDVKDVNISEKTKPTGEFEYFDIKYGKIEEELGDRLGAAIKYAGGTWEEVKRSREDIQDMHKDTRKGQSCIKDSIQDMHKDLKSEIKGSREDIQDMHKDLKSEIKGSREDIQDMHKDLKSEIKGSREDIQNMHKDTRKGQNCIKNSIQDMHKDLKDELKGFRDETKTEFQIVKTDYGKISQDLGKAVDSINTIAKSIEKLAEAIAKK